MPSVFRPDMGLRYSVSRYEDYSHSNDHTLGVVSETGTQHKDWLQTNDYFGKKARKEKIPTLDFSCTTIRYVNSHGDQTYTPLAFPDQFHRMNGVTDSSKPGCMFIPRYNPPIPSDSDLITFIQNRCSASLLAAVKNEKINLAQTFAEVQQTANLVTGTVKRLVTSILYLKQGNFRAAARSLTKDVPPKLYRRKLDIKSRPSKEEVASEWLALQYGWRPLYSDVYGAAEQLAEHNNRIRVKKISRGTYWYNENDASFRQTGWNDSIPIMDHATARFHGKYSVEFRITNDAAKTIAQTGISNPALLAWELVPFSFVADWFIPVGDFLSAFDATAGATLLNSTVSLRLRHEYTCKCSGSAVDAGPYGHWLYEGDQETFRSEDRVIRRAVSTWPANHFPSFENPLRLTRVANALALLTVLTR